MIVNITHTKLPKMKNSEIVGTVGAISNSIYSIISSGAIEADASIASLLYIISVFSNTGSAILDKWEKNGKDENNSTEDENNV